MSDISEESDAIGHLVEQSDHDESDASAESSSSRGIRADAAPLGFLDVEAAESDGESSGSERSGAGRRGVDAAFFPQFKCLPVELRRRVWEVFCPDLARRHRVYFLFPLVEVQSGSGPARLRVTDGPFLAQQTEPARAVLAVHHESRQLALRAFPDALPLDVGGVLRFSADRDVIALLGLELTRMRFGKLLAPRGFREHIRHLAVEPEVLEGHLSRLCEMFDGLQTVYYISGPRQHPPRHLRWCVSELALRYELTTTEEEPGLGEDAQYMLCWPDLGRRRGAAETEIPLAALAQDLAADNIYITDVQRSDTGPKILPMIQFSFESEAAMFNHLADWDGETELEWYLSDDGYDDSEPDEYESEGIDDSDISEQRQGDSDSDDLAVLSDSGSEQEEEEEEEEGSERSSSELSASPPDSAGAAIDLVAAGDEPLAVSSPEHSSATLDGSDDPAPRPSRRKRPRARIVESDSEDGGGEDGGPRKRPRTEGRRIPIVLSSDDEEDGARRKVRANRRARVVLSEDDDAAQSGSDGSDGGAAVLSRPLTLAEKLQVHRERAPIPSSDEDDYEAAEVSGDDDYDNRDYADFQDDEEGDEVTDGDDGQDAVVLESDQDDDEGGY